MAWFTHRHWWRIKTGLNVIKSPTGRISGALIIEDCACGAVRQIEYAPGVAPTIRITPAPAALNVVE